MGQVGLYGSPEARDDGPATCCSKAIRRAVRDAIASGLAVGWLPLGVVVAEGVEGREESADSGCWANREQQKINS